MTDLSILIPARNEMFLKRTVEDILEHARGDTEVIVVLDGSWPEEGIPDNPRVHLIHHSVSIGQRAATNEAARLSTARYVMKCDAHCAFDEGFDVKLMETFEHNWTVIPRMYNLHVFDWVCKACGHRQYHSPKPERCAKCEGGPVEMELVWKPRRNRRTDFARFDTNLHFQYWGQYERRPEAQGQIADVMCCVGACWMMERTRFWELGGLDEAHGSWGQMGVEVACKTWLSGGRQVVNKNTWFAHLFRTQPGFGFPYPNPGAERAREHSRHLWLGNNWSGAVRPFKWILEKFAPVPDWENYTEPTKPSEPCQTSTPSSGEIGHEAGLVYYTDSRIDERLASYVRRQISRSCNGHNVVSVSLNKPVPFGKNICLQAERGQLTMFKQILAGLEACEAEYVFLVEHDVLYHPSHFTFVPPRDDVYYYNTNTWKVDAETGRALYYLCQQTLGLCASRKLLLQHYRARVERVEREGWSMSIGYEPGTHSRPRGIDDYKAESWVSEYPNIDIRHGKNLTKTRWSQDEFRNKRYCTGWMEASGVPGWGETLGRFQEFLREVENAP